MPDKLPRPNNKVERQRIFIELLSDPKRKLQSQAQVQNVFKNKGYAVSQAAISRDIKELGIGRDSKNNYTLPEHLKHKETHEQLRRSLAKSSAKLHTSVAHITLSTEPGYSQFLAIAIKETFGGDIIGTICGDDTLLILTYESKKQVIENQLQEFLTDFSKNT